MYYRKKPVTVSAFQMTRERRADMSAWPSWLFAAWNKHHSEKGALFAENLNKSDGTDNLWIKTLEGDQLVSWDDYIIRGVKGEIYPCKPEIFEMTYDKVDEKTEELVQSQKTVKVIDTTNKSLMDIYFEIDPTGKLWDEMKSYQADNQLTNSFFVYCMAFIVLCLLAVLFFRP